LAPRLSPSQRMNVIYGAIRNNYMIPRKYGDFMEVNIGPRKKMGAIARADPSLDVPDREKQSYLINCIAYEINNTLGAQKTQKYTRTRKKRVGPSQTGWVSIRAVIVRKSSPTHETTRVSIRFRLVERVNNDDLAWLHSASPGVLGLGERRCDEAVHGGGLQGPY